MAISFKPKPAASHSLRRSPAGKGVLDPDQEDDVVADFQRVPENGVIIAAAIRRILLAVFPSTITPGGVGHCPCCMDIVVEEVPYFAEQLSDLRFGVNLTPILVRGHRIAECTVAGTRINKGVAFLELWRKVPNDSFRTFGIGADLVVHTPHNSCFVIVVYRII